MKTTLHPIATIPWVGAPDLVYWVLSGMIFVAAVIASGHAVNYKREPRLCAATWYSTFEQCHEHHP